MSLKMFKVKMLHCTFETFWWQRFQRTYSLTLKMSFSLKTITKWWNIPPLTVKWWPDTKPLLVIKLFRSFGFCCRGKSTACVFQIAIKKPPIDGLLQGSLYNIQLYHNLLFLGLEKLQCGGGVKTAKVIPVQVRGCFNIFIVNEE